MLRIALRPGHEQRRKGWLIDAKRLLIQDDSSWSLPALIANFVTTWNLTLCAYCLMTMTMMMVPQVPFIEYLLCGGNLWTSSPFFLYNKAIRQVLFPFYR